MKHEAINPKHRQAVMELVNESPYFKLLQMKISDIGAGYANVELTIDQRHCNNFGGVHGGVYASLIDTAAYWATYCEISADSGCTSIDVTVNNLSSVQSGKVIAQGRSVKVGRTLCLAEAVVKDEAGRILAQGASKLLILNGKQTMNQSVAQINGQPLPPKFLTP